MGKKQKEPSQKIRLSVHTAELLEVYARAFAVETGVTLSLDQAVERLVQVFVGNPLAAQELQKSQGAANG